ncbi:MAG: DEAD/DEAH box helicase [Lewinellaceae bacterium]|nr:DEAD/DEAH box helicase [Lewinellaceae bacterium]
MKKYNPGKLVRVRGRDWVIQPSPDPDLVVIKPLGGADAETTGIYLPLGFKEDGIEDAPFPLPGVEDIGSFSDAKLLYNAARLSFRSGAGPFRALGKLSFRPRSYQMVPLIMALRQEVTRLLIADDVGVGKTIEALLVVKELLERREIERFAVICLPHLCEQWQAELQEKFGIEAVIIRSNTQARLDREIHGDTSVYTYYPYQVISVDYIKSDARRLVFVNECPEMVIVDEAHTCSRAAGPQHQRYDLIKRISDKPGQHLVLLTATPHSGKQSQFQSLLGLLKPSFEEVEVATADQKERRRLAQHYVQRKRADVENWMQGETTPFPKRDAGEYPYQLSPKYASFYDRMLDFVTELAQEDGRHAGQQRFRYWTALALLRGVMSSPPAGMKMLENRMQKQADEDTLALLSEEENPVLDADYGAESDVEPSEVVGQAKLSDSESRRLRSLRGELEGLQGIEHDAKLKRTLEVCREWLAGTLPFHPVIFCRYIETAKYVGKQLKPLLEESFSGVNVQVVTSEDPDEVRQERILAMEGSKRRVLVATDCLSEGVNLQTLFTAVLHYDLPWNPNRLEQREGRVDRFGQKAPVVKAYMLYGKDNPIDGTVLEVLLRKVAEIKKETGISMPFPEDSTSIMEAILQAVLINPKRVQQSMQMSLFPEDEIFTAKKLEATHSIEEAAEREKATRSIFAQNAIKAQEIEQDLQDVDEAIGNPAAVESFVLGACNWLGIQWRQGRAGFILELQEVPDLLRDSLPHTGGDKIKVAFEAPVEEGYHYLGRNHPFVDQLCQYMLSRAFQEEPDGRLNRAAVIRTDQVKTMTTLVLFRVRSVIESSNRRNQLIAEEMLPWGYRGLPEEEDFLSTREALELMETVQATADYSPQQRAGMLRATLEDMQQGEVQEQFNALARRRAEHLIDAHARFRKLLGGHQYQVVEPVLPMDVMGVYILNPE